PREGGQCGGAHSFQTCWAGAATEAGIIHSPNFNGAFAESFRVERNPSFWAIGHAVEAQDVGIKILALSPEPRTRGPDFQFAILEWNGLPRGAMGINPIRRWKKD